MYRNGKRKNKFSVKSTTQRISKATAYQICTCFYKWAGLCICHACVQIKSINIYQCSCQEIE